MNAIWNAKTFGLEKKLLNWQKSKKYFSGVLKVGDELNEYFTNL